MKRSVVISTALVALLGLALTAASGDDAPTLRSNMPPINLFCGPPAHATKWTLVVDPPQEARRLALFDTQVEVHAEIIRLRERGVAHVFALVQRF